MHKTLLGSLDKDTLKIVFDRSTVQDQWRLATASGSIYRLFGQRAQKNIVYSFSVIPEGALEHPIFSKYPLNYAALIKFLRIRGRHQKFIASEFRFFDYEDVWPLMAIMGNEMGLRELIGQDPQRKDANDKSVLDYLAFCGHQTALVNWIDDYYPDFWPGDAPLLNYYAALGGSEEVLIMLIAEYAYYLSDEFAKKGWVKDRVNLLYPALWGKHVSLVRLLIDAGAETYDYYRPWKDNLSLHAAEMGLWDLYQEFMAQESEPELARFNDNRMLYLEAAACSNRQDKMEEIRTKRVRLGTPEPYEEFDLSVSGEYICHAALRSGQIELVDFCVEKSWVEINGVFSSNRMDDNQEDKQPALFVAAIYGQLKMFDHLVEKYGLDPHVLFKGDTVLHWMIVRTTWSNYEYICEKYFADTDFLSNDGYRPPVVEAIQAGKLYNVQQYLKTYCDDNFIRDYGDELISFAEECEHYIIAKWLRHKLASLKPAEEHSNLVNSGAIFQV